MRFRVTKEKLADLTLDQMCTLEAMSAGDDYTLRSVREIMEAMMVDDATGKPLDAKAAHAELGKLRSGGLQDAVKQFAEAIKDGLLPPMNGAA